ncbi:hypothetical protein GCM10022296_06730 [Secundilactobacillus similis DSM 23365 = JCM 2765]
MGGFCPFLAPERATAFQLRIAPESPAASSHHIKPESLHKLNMLTLDTSDSKIARCAIAQRAIGS